MSLKYGWYSPKQAKQNEDLTIYRKVNGDLTYITCVSETEDHGCSHEDLLFVGMVTAYVGSKSKRYNT